MRGISDNPGAGQAWINNRSSSWPRARWRTADGCNTRSTPAQCRRPGTSQILHTRICRNVGWRATGGVIRALAVIGDRGKPAAAVLTASWCRDLQTVPGSTPGTTIIMIAIGELAGGTLRQFRVLIEAHHRGRHVSAGRWTSGGRPHATWAGPPRVTHLDAGRPTCRRGHDTIASPR